MIAQSNVTTMLVGKDLDLQPAGGTKDSLAVGQIGVYKVGASTCVDESSPLADGDRFQIVAKKADGILVYTPVIEYSRISAKSAVEYAAPTYASSAIGFNGTSGSIDDQNYTNYTAHVIWYDNSKTMGYGKPVKFGTYYSSGSATQAEIAAGFVQNLNKNAKRENPQIIKAEVLINDAGTALGTAVDTITLKNGSVYFTADDIDDATTNAALAVGDFLRIGTGLTDSCYKIVAIDAVNNIGTLDTAYQGADYSAEDVAFERIPAATAATSDAGIKLTALPTTAGWQVGVSRYDVTNFDVSLGYDFGVTTLTELSKSSVGSGTYYEVAYNEWFLKGNTTETWRVGNYPKQVNLEATLGKTYDQVSLNYVDANARTIDRSVESFGSVLIATEDASSGAVHANLKTILGIS